MNESHLAEQFQAKVVTLADYFNLSQTFVSEPEAVVKMFSPAGIGSSIAERLVLGLKVYVWGGRSWNVSARRPDGPLERLKQRRPWLQKLLGQVRYQEFTFSVSELLPGFDYKIPRGIGDTVTLNISGDAEASINLVRVEKPDMADLEFDMLRTVGPENAHLVDKVLSRFVVDPERKDSR